MNTFVGTTALVRLILRRDRIALSVWIAIVALLGAAVASSMTALYTTPAEIQTVLTEIASSPGTLALLGPVYAPNVGALTAWRWTMQGAIILGLFNLFTVIRHTRADEQAGRRELVASAVVGRYAPLTAALLVAFGADFVLAALVTGSLAGLGLPAAGSLALGLSVAGAGAVVAAVAGVAAQLTEGAGPARGMAGAVFGLFYLLRSFGDLGGARGELAWLSWLSPLGWARLTRPFAGERWWLLALLGGAVGLFVAVAYALSARRDLGAGLLPPLRCAPPWPWLGGCSEARSWGGLRRVPSLAACLGWSPGP
jgi:ABC-2 type transport system permease protein